MRYLDARKSIQNGDVLLFESRGWVAATIRWATRSRFSHAALAAWWGERLMLIESREGSGCRALPLSEAVKTGRIVLFKPVGVPDTEPASPQDRDSDRYARLGVALGVPVWVCPRDRVVEAAKARIGQPYGWWAIVRDALGRLPLLALLWRRRHYSLDDLEDPGTRVKCSTLVALAWRAAGRDLVPNLADRSTDPGDLARSAALREVYALEP